LLTQWPAGQRGARNGFTRRQGSGRSGGGGARTALHESARPAQRQDLLQPGQRRQLCLLGDHRQQHHEANGQHRGPLCQQRSRRLPPQRGGCAWLLVALRRLWRRAVRPLDGTRADHPHEWHSFSNFKQDVGYIIVNDRNGQRIVNRLGGQGSRFNVSRDQQFRAYGYPQASPFNGFNQYVCPSKRLANDTPGSRPGPQTMRISCNMTGGSSGGGWLIAESGGLGFVNSVNSYKYVSGPKANANHMYGPYFGNEALDLFNFTVGLG